MILSYTIWDYAEIPTQKLIYILIYLEISAFLLFINFLIIFCTTKFWKF